MEKLVYLTPDFAVASQMDGGDFEQAARLGFRAIVNNRPDGEDEGQPTSQAVAAKAWAAGLTYSFVPVDNMEIFTDRAIDDTAHAIAAGDGPVLAFCKSGTRCAIVWAAAQVRQRHVCDVLDDLKRAGFELDFLRDDLETQAARANWLPSSPAGSSAVCDDGDVVALPTAVGASG